MEWLRERAPGFDQLSENERSAITDFSLLWSLFEAQILASHGNAGRIRNVVKKWHGAEILDAETYDAELDYFRSRYFANGDVTYHFQHLLLRENDQPELVRTVMDGSNIDPSDRVAAILIIIYRYRNNLFHGNKWQYHLSDQLDNFTHANSVLKKVLEKHGQLNAR